ncbi:hypothetical protein V5H34_10920 [Vibrio cholerae]|uniref:hypothetical protein n=1 Tax=Vibrio cholerae TaxID=666 RepID=UPI00068A7AC0|nr:hypothetical protein [Vibrio cholerae]HDB1439722.1 hypothetical protein [Vibrio cholerae]HDB1450831.1 hypothetical protein [Vibrio cholerae]
MSNKVFAVICVLVLCFFSIISILKEDKSFSGEVIFSHCIETGKSEESVEVIVSNGEVKKRFSFGLGQYVCKDAVELISAGNLISVSYESFKGRFVTVNEVSLNGKSLLLRGEK